MHLEGEKNCSCIYDNEDNCAINNNKFPQDFVRLGENWQVARNNVRKVTGPFTTNASNKRTSKT